MTISISDLLTPQSATQVRATMVTTLKSLGVPADQWVPGGVFSTILTVVATLYAIFTNNMAQAIGSGFLETATGGWLTLVAYYVYGVTRPPATFASGQITLTNSGGGVYSYAPGQVTFLDLVNGQTYTNTQAISLGALATQTVGIQCTAAGKLGTAAPGEITKLVTTMLGVTVSNSASVVGQDALDDPSLRALCLDRLGTLSVRGPRNAYAYAVSVAVSPTTGQPVNINRPPSITRSSHTGTVSLVVASPTGAPTADDLQGVRNAIELGVPGLTPPFSGVRPDCVTVTVAGATPVTYAPAIPVWALQSTGVVANDVATEVAAAITDYLATFPVGGVTTDQGTGLWHTGIEAAASQGVSATILAIEGATDLALSPGQVAVDEVTVAVRLVNVA